MGSAALCPDGVRRTKSKSKSWVGGSPNDPPQPPRLNYAVWRKRSRNHAPKPRPEPRREAPSVAAAAVAVAAAAVVVVAAVAKFLLCSWLLGTGQLCSVIATHGCNVFGSTATTRRVKE